MLKRISDRWLLAALILLPLLLIARCWNAEFLTYDDVDHIQLALNSKRSLLQLFNPDTDSTYFPITLLSYRLDAFLFSWMISTFGTWAPAVRVMTVLYHGGAACFVWLLLQRLRVSRNGAFFIALAFAVHPMVCETVCWVAERKNALSGLFGFAALWLYLRFENRPWVLLPSGLSWTCAVMSKPSALGLLPLLAILALINGSRAFEPGAPLLPRRGIRDYASILLQFTPLIVAAWFLIQLNLVGHTITLVEPPGGSIYTAILTDTEVLARYLYNLFVPVDLSFVYFVAPIMDAGDPRLWIYGALLLTLMVVSVWLAENRRRATFGWCWFIAALSPSLNIISIPQIMQDRYLYLSMPGMLLVFVEFYSGLALRLKLRDKLTAAVAGAYLAALLSLAVMRGGVFTDVFSLFIDAERKQPRASSSHRSLAVAYAQYGNMLLKAGKPREAQEVFHEMGKEIITFLDCPDATRYPTYGDLAVEAGRYLSEQKNDNAGGLRYFEIALHTNNITPKARIAARKYHSALLQKIENH
jgi:hypothetical protein